MIDILRNRALFVASCVQTSYADAVAVLGSLLRDKPSRWQFREMSGSSALGAVCGRMPPAGATHLKQVGVIDKSRYVVLIANLQDGWQSLAFVLSKKLAVDAHIFTISDMIKSENPKNAFTYVSSGKTIRHVSLLKEDKWIFHQQGVPFVEEDLASYSNSKKQNRLGPESVVSLGRHLGYDIGNLDFYESARAGVFCEENEERN